MSHAQSWSCNKECISLEMPLIMGILNVTPDSFSDGGSYQSVQEAVGAALAMVDQGADIIDVGGESTRPGSDEVSVEEELNRVLPVVRELARKQVRISIDTRHAKVAQAALEAGACIVNNISGFTDPEMQKVAANSECGLIVMHMQGEPKSMQSSPEYGNVVVEVKEYLLQRAAELEGLGISRNRIALDPGPGFGKTTDHDFELLRSLDALANSGYPVVGAVSRKRHIADVTSVLIPANRDTATAALSVLLAQSGATVLRVHNVAATSSALRVGRAFKDKRSPAYIALGSNMGDRLEYLSIALAEIEDLPLTAVAQASAVYESKPAYREDQEPFANAVVKVWTALDPHVLLDKLLGIEDKMGRVRTEPGGPRIIDLDLLLYGARHIETTALIMPHPRLGERAFVLTPLSDVLPNMARHLGRLGIEVLPETERLGSISNVLATADDWARI